MLLLTGYRPADPLVGVLRAELGQDDGEHRGWFTIECGAEDLHNILRITDWYADKERNAPAEMLNAGFILKEQTIRVSRWRATAGMENAFRMFRYTTETIIASLPESVNMSQMEGLERVEDESTIRLECNVASYDVATNQRERHIWFSLYLPLQQLTVQTVPVPPSVITHLIEHAW